MKNLRNLRNMTILKIKDWLASKNAHFSITNTLYGAIIIVNRLKDDKIFRLGEIIGSEDLLEYDGTSYKREITIYDFNPDLIHVTLEATLWMWNGSVFQERSRAESVVDIDYLE